MTTMPHRWMQTHDVSMRNSMMFAGRIRLVRPLFEM